MTDQPIAELPEEMRGNPMHQEANKGLMVAWINHDLLNRCVHDVRKSFVIYDADGLFEYALVNPPSELKASVLQQAHDTLGWRYWSKGIA